MVKEGTLYYFLLHKTQPLELCAICEDGWVTSTVWIDHEDLFLVHPKLMNRKVESDRWEEITLRAGAMTADHNYGPTMRVPCHYIYLSNEVVSE